MLDSINKLLAETRKTTYRDPRLVDCVEALWELIEAHAEDLTAIEPIHGWLGYHLAVRAILSHGSVFGIDQ